MRLFEAGGKSSVFTAPKSTWDLQTFSVHQVLSALLGRELSCVLSEGREPHTGTKGFHCTSCLHNNLQISDLISKHLSSPKRVLVFLNSRPLESYPAHGNSRLPSHICTLSLIWYFWVFFRFFLLFQYPETSNVCAVAWPLSDFHHFGSLWKSCQHFRHNGLVPDLPSFHLGPTVGP